MTRESTLTVLPTRLQISLISMLSKSASALPRRTHRKRVRYSTDTTTTLPEYHPTSTTEYHPQPQHHSDSFYDKPPDYPDSAEEADEDTDSETARSFFRSSVRIDCFTFATSQAAPLPTQTQVLGSPSQCYELCGPLYRLITGA